VPPPPHGTKIRINEFQPGFLNSAGLQSPVHRTASIDYGIVLEGQITLVLDDSEVTLHAGDVVVQRGTDHAWANRGKPSPKWRSSSSTLNSTERWRPSCRAQAWSSSCAVVRRTEAVLPACP
jgi:uncharacterized cupin superfamily protein